MTAPRVTPLNIATWPDLAALAERPKGVWGGCRCMAFHPEGIGRGRTTEQNRCEKERRVREGGARAALVRDGETCVGRCRFGPEDTRDRSASASLLFTGTVRLFERHGSERIRPLGKHHRVMSRTVVRDGRRAGS
ncbi:hypothetical protein [Streptomyces dubilierae]|uniref:Uncharacterized protein n=1 Tax=Streptomyces dubilierae TaxID=3075533 RepID=A0ABU2PL12_9ACTN|nr:hypothetical protein [Streptomyces sp. DSM 41921]MDT0392846.1 hypothetical protein [Streptomyces sp. DSM 41921]